MSAPSHVVSLLLSREMIEKIDKAIIERGYRNRSDFVRRSIEYFLSIEGWEIGEPGTYAATVMVSYVFGKVNQETLADLTFKYRDAIRSVQRIFANENLCIDVYLLCGEAEVIKGFIETLNSIKGINYVGESIYKLF